MPTPGFVVKTRADFKIFINVCYSPDVPKPEPFNEDTFNLIIENKWEIPINVSEEKSTTDKKGIPSIVFDCCINTDCYQWIQENEDLKLILIEWCIESVESLYKLSLDRAYSLPKMSAKGELSEVKPKKLIVEEDIAEEVTKNFGHEENISLSLPSSKSTAPSKPFEVPWEYSVSIKNKVIIIRSNKSINKFTYYQNCINFNGVKVPVFDKKNATTYNVVHRAHDDPRYYDDESSGHVLVKGVKELKKNVKGMRENEGLAAQYGITYDDSKYDYMQHLKPMGEGVFVPVEELFPDNVPSKGKNKISRDLNQSIPDEFKGFNPDLDPRLREVLEALEDDAYIGSDDELDNLIQSGQADDDYEGAENEVEDDWDRDYYSDEFDDLGSLPEFTKRKGGGSFTSMSSSALNRTEGLTLLDDRYEILNKQYQEDPEDDYKPFDMKEERNDFEGLLDEFLENYELESGGRKLAKKDIEKTNIRLAASSVSKGKDAKKLSDKFGKLSL